MEREEGSACSGTSTGGGNRDSGSDDDDDSASSARLKGSGGDTGNGRDGGARVGITKMADRFRGKTCRQIGSWRESGRVTEGRGS